MCGKISITWFFWHLAIYGKLFFCRLINIFLTQFWTENLLIHKPQPRHTTVTTLTRVTRVTLFTTVIQITIKRPAYRLDFSKARGGPWCKIVTLGMHRRPLWGLTKNSNTQGTNEALIVKLQLLQFWKLIQLQKLLRFLKFLKFIGLILLLHH